MKTFKAIVAMAILTAGLQAVAAIGCRPGMDNCPGDPGDNPRPLPVETELTVIGYAEIPSPNCSDVHLQRAIHEATANAIAKAEFSLGQDAVQTKPFFYSQRCGQGFYSNSVPGNSWIVQAFAVYSKPKSN